MRFGGIAHLERAHTSRSHVSAGEHDDAPVLFVQHGRPGATVVDVEDIADHRRRGGVLDVEPLRWNERPRQPITYKVTNQLIGGGMHHQRKATLAFDIETPCARARAAAGII